MAKKAKGTFKSVAGEKEYIDCYDSILRRWPVSTEEIRLPTSYGETNVIVSGKDGQPSIALLHPLSTGSAMWNFGIKTLSKHHRVYAIDTIGNAGKSRATRLPQIADEYSMWLNEVFEHLGLNEVILIGASYGGSIALRYAINRQDKINRMILLFPPFGLVRTKPSLILKILPFSFGMNEKKAEKLLSLMCSNISQLDEDLRRLLVLSTLHFTPYTLVMKPCSDKDLQNIKVPLTFIVGEEEILFDRKQAVERMKRNISQCKNIVIPGMKHIGTKEELAEINEILDATLHRESSGGTSEPLERRRV